jgi:hypothetical protein
MSQFENNKKTIRKNLKSFANQLENAIIKAENQ